MNRILVTGNAGSGKSTLARRVASVLGLPCHGLDRIVWQSGWRKTPRDERNLRIEEITKKECWVIDGVSLEVQAKADVVIFLDVPRRLCFWRAMKRNMRYLFHSRPELPPRCPEISIIPALCKIIWNFPANVRPRILDSGCRSAESQSFFHVRNREDMENLLEELSSKVPSSSDAVPASAVISRRINE